jgi:ATP:corrinoid adenosyltransferase
MLRLEDMQPASQQPVAQTRGKQGIVQTATGQHHTTNAFGMGRLTDPLGKRLTSVAWKWAAPRAASSSSASCASKDRD